MPQLDIWLVPPGQVLHPCLLGERLAAGLALPGGAGDRPPPGVGVRHPGDHAGRPPHTGSIQVNEDWILLCCHCIVQGWKQ